MEENIGGPRNQNTVKKIDKTSQYCVKTTRIPKLRFSVSTSNSHAIVHVLNLQLPDGPQKVE